MPQDVILSWTAGEFASLMMSTSGRCSRTSMTPVAPTRRMYLSARVRRPRRTSFRPCSILARRTTGVLMKSMARPTTPSSKAKSGASPSNRLLIAITDVTVDQHRCSSEAPGSGPEKHRQRLRASTLNDQHSTAIVPTCGKSSRPVDGDMPTIEIEYAFDAVYKLHEMLGLELQRAVRTVARLRRPGCHRSNTPTERHRLVSSWATSSPEPGDGIPRKPTPPTTTIDSRWRGGASTSD